MTKAGRSFGWEENRTEWILCIAAGLVAMVFLISVIAFSIHRSSIRDTQERAARIEREFTEIKNGHKQAIFFGDTELLSKLANDQKCIENVSELQFWMVELSKQDGNDVSKLKNVTRMIFAYTKGTDRILQVATRLPIESLSFEQASLDSNSLRQLAKFERLQEVRFINPLSQEEIDVLDSLPTHVTVKRPVEIRPKQ